MWLLGCDPGSRSPDRKPYVAARNKRNSPKDQWTPNAGQQQATEQTTKERDRARQQISNRNKPPIALRSRSAPEPHGNSCSRQTHGEKNDTLG